MRVTVKIPGVRGTSGAEPSRSRRWARRTASWLPVLSLFGVLAAVRLDAPGGVISTLLAAALVALVVDVIFFVLSLNRHA
jgi:hypothetical protein